MVSAFFFPLVGGAEVGTVCFRGCLAQGISEVEGGVGVEYLLW